MTHDPVCRFIGVDVPDNPADCLVCSSIAKVREDERAAAVQRVLGICTDCWFDSHTMCVGEDKCRCRKCDYNQGERDMLAKCIAAVEDCRVPWPTHTGVLVNEGIDDALSALRALQENP